MMKRIRVYLILCCILFFVDSINAMRKRIVRHSNKSTSAKELQLEKSKLKKSLSLDSFEKSQKMNKLFMREKKDKDKKEGFLCGICCDTADNIAGVTQLVCGHSFHMGCVLKSIEVNPLCPLCRHEIKTDNVKIKKKLILIIRRRSARQRRFSDNLDFEPDTDTDDMDTDLDIDRRKHCKKCMLNGVLALFTGVIPFILTYRHSNNQNNNIQ